MSIDETINQAFEPVADVTANIVFFSIEIMEGLEVKLILLWLIAVSLFLTIYLGFVNFRYFLQSFKLVFDKSITGSGDGQLSSFQALMASLSGTVGLGNIAGVAVAVSVGGPGATVWMIIMGFLSMSTKYAEVYLGIKYRRHMDKDHPDEVSGGPMYYLKAAFDQKNMPRLGTFMAGFFALCCICGAVGGGNMFQSNQAFVQLVNVTGGFPVEGVTDQASWLADKGWLFGLGLAALVGVVIIGGIRSIGHVAAALVPTMGAIYVLFGLLIIAMFWQNIPSALSIIFTSAFSMEAGIGGLLGGVLVGVQRAAFSNESGLGSAAIVHAAVKTESPVAQGIVGMQGPFIDTIVICTITALVIVVTGAYEGGAGVEGVQLTSRAFEAGFSWAPYVLAISVLLFAYSTIITWAYYGEKALTYLFGESDQLVMAYNIVFCAFIVLGASTQLTSIIDFTDAMILSLAIPNIVGLYMLAPEVKKDLAAYTVAQKAKKQGVAS
jgi:alanine or glycine:cation symporter, AGCS family